MATTGKTVNYFSPLFSSSPYGAMAFANSSDVPVRWANSDVTPEQLARKLAYEWYQSNQTTGEYSNPPFLTGAAGRLSPVLRDAQNYDSDGVLRGTPRILRGYIRRAEYDNRDNASKSRLYFMFNPETITRDYVSYLDQAALDPFNTVFGSDNLVAPPSFMNFSFELFFDRQDELAQDMDHPGVFVDYQFFDLVVRNVIPTDPNGANTAIPDNGVMMVNPRDITVIFSPQLTVQGRPINAQVNFEKFSHRMTPTRMRISLTIRVVYIGPVKPQIEADFLQYEQDTKDSVAADETAEITFTFDDLVIADGAADGAAGWQSGADPDVQALLGNQTALFNAPNTAARGQAYAWAKAHVVEGYTQYNRDRRGSGLDEQGLLKFTDCSGLVWNAYNGVGLTDKMGWGGSISGPTSTDGMLNYFKSSSWRSADSIANWGPATVSQARVYFNAQEDGVYVNRAPTPRGMMQGDLLFRDSKYSSNGIGHVAFFDHWEGNRLIVFAASGPAANPQVGMTSISFETFVTTYNYLVRTRPFGSDSSSGLVNNTGHVGRQY